MRINKLRLGESPLWQQWNSVIFPLFIKKINNNNNDDNDDNNKCESCSFFLCWWVMSFYNVNKKNEYEGSYFSPLLWITSFGTIISTI